MLSLPQRGALPGGVAVHLESRHHQLAVRAVLHGGSHREPLASAGWRTRPSSGARRRGQRRGGGRWTSPLSRSCVMASCGCPRGRQPQPDGAGLMRIRRSKTDARARACCCTWARRPCRPCARSGQSRPRRMFPSSACSPRLLRPGFGRQMEVARDGGQVRRGDSGGAVARYHIKGSRACA